MSAPRIEFDANQHRYRVDGNVYPSVTQVLKGCGGYGYYGRVEQAVLDAKRRLGEAVHRACEFDDVGDLDESTVPDEAMPYVRADRLFRLRTRGRVIASELRVASTVYGYAGTLDLLVDIDGARWVIDRKTPLIVSPTTALQTAAYLNALPAELREPTMRRAALHLRPDGSYLLHEFRDTSDFATFAACLTVWRFKEKHGWTN